MQLIKRALFLLLVLPLYLSADWTPGVTLGDKNSNGSDVIMDSQGNATAVWMYSTEHQTTIRGAKQLAGQTWSPSVEIGSGYYPDIATDKEGNVMAIWYSTVRTHPTKDPIITIHGAILPSNSTDGWIPVDDIPTHISEITKVPSLGLDENGNALVVWVSKEKTNILIQAARYNKDNKTWTILSPIKLSDFNSYNFALDPHGNAVLLWYVYKDSTSTLQTATLQADSKKWDLQKQFKEIKGLVWGTSLAVDKEGNAFLIWSEGDDSNVKASTLPFKGKTWQKTIFPNVMSYYPRIRLDDQGNATAVYIPHGSKTALFESTFLPKSSLQWSDPQTAVPNNSNFITFYNLGVDPAGNALLVWEDRTLGSVQAALLPAGQSWSSPISLDTVQSLQDTPRIALSPVNSATLTYTLFVEEYPDGPLYCILRSVTGTDLFITK